MTTNLESDNVKVSGKLLIGEAAALTTGSRLKDRNAGSGLAVLPLMFATDLIAGKLERRGITGGVVLAGTAPGAKELLRLCAPSDCRGV